MEHDLGKATDAILRSYETGGGIKLSVPHIRLDRAMQFLFGDRLA